MLSASWAGNGAVMMLRRSPVKRTGIKRGRTRIPAVNRSRAEKLRRYQFGPPEYVEFLRAHRCCTCETDWPIVDASHAAKTRAAGGRPWHMVPQCRMCHNLVHLKGVDSAFPGFDYEAEGMRIYEAALERGIIQEDER